MNRKDFLKTCGFSCIVGSAALPLLQSCTSSRALSGYINNSDLIVQQSDFETTAAGEIHYKKYIIVNNDKLKYPVCVYRFSNQEYKALWLQCPHQGAELQVFGDKLQCPAHGSEFDHNGTVASGPASQNLRTFPVTINKGQLMISLKAV